MKKTRTLHPRQRYKDMIYGYAPGMSELSTEKVPLYKWRMSWTNTRLTSLPYRKCDGRDRDGHVEQTVTSFMWIHSRQETLVSWFNPKSDRIATIRIKPKYFYITLNCVHAPKEDKDEDIKYAFYERLEEIYDRYPTHDVKIVLGDFNAEIGREDALGSAVGKFGMYNITSVNGFRLFSYESARDMVVIGTRFLHKDIHKVTWISPDQTTRNQIHHVVIN